MKQIIVLAILLFSTAAKADWTPGTVLLGQFQQQLYTADDPKAVITAGVYSRLKRQLSALVLAPWSKQTKNKVQP